MKSAHSDPIDSIKYVCSAEKDCAWIAIVYGVFVGMLSLAVPIGVQALVNSVAFGSLLQPLVVMTVLIFVALFFSGTLQLLQYYAVELLQCRVFSRTALKSAEMLLTDDLEGRISGRPKTSVSRFLEITSLQKSAATLIIDGITLALQIGIGMILLAFYHPFLLAFDLLLAGALIAIVQVLGKGAVGTSIQESAQKYDVLESLEAIQRSPLSFRSAHASAYILKNTDLQVLQFLRSRRRHFAILFKQAAGTFCLQALASALLLGVGGWLVIHNQLTLGQLVAAELVLTSVLTSLAKLPKYFESFYDLAASADKTVHMLDVEKERDTGHNTVPPENLAMTPILTVHGLVYERPDSNTVLSGTDLSFALGETVALFGLTGSGKSSFFDLIMRVKNTEQGSFKLAGFDTRDLRLGNLRSHVMLLRERAFLDATISENIALWHAGDVDPNRINRCVAQSGLIHRTTTLPHGLGTKLSFAGAPLTSVEQVQLLIARAIFISPAVVLVDELFDPFDDNIRAGLVKALIGNCPGATVIIATERADVAQLCSRQMTISREGQQWRIKA